MKKIGYAFLILGLISCGKVKPSGDIDVKDVNIQEYKDLNLKGKFKIFYVNNPKNFVSVETYPNVYDNLDIKVKNNTLYIAEKRPTQGVDFYNITLYTHQHLENIVMADSTDMTISSQMTTPNFSLVLKDNAKFSGSILANKAKIDMDKKTRANVLGSTLDATIAIRDTASIIAPFWYIENLKLTSKNGNYTEVSVAKNLEGSIANTSQLVYYGTPEKNLKVTEQAKVEQKKQP
ncbi:GIN domain-containing protein [Elizabethkingia sp. JS20170427COW]|uniref:GIN domain-containing protein n=1 Tax=Elizabethkingia sp. JS20170427COW TaxID=2583851 RepID=UPI0011109CF7|nr:DUF2807 domain-containing protein [Elizabethkingia sp. JS20170427COW]QCX52458.1 DUF2807 domain-containing protein [Elizabethkingia sp. JS20170427COW]